MKTRVLARLVCLLCVLCLAASFASAARASEEPPAVEAEQAAGEMGPAPEAEAFGNASTEDGPDGEPIEDETDGDPISRRMEVRLDGGAAKYSDVTPRALHDEILLRGVDVSYYQKNIDWSAAAADGVEFAIIRAAYRTYGTGVLYRDSYFDANMRGAKAAGVKVGAYIFSQAITVEEAVAEADYLLSLVEGYDVDLPLVFDFEYISGGRLTRSLGKRLSTDICLAFCKRVEEAGYESMVYANPSTLNGYLYPREFGRVWLAHYTTQSSYAGSDYEYWQFTDSGVVNGISGVVDLDFWFEPIGTGMPFVDVRAEDWFCEDVKAAYDGKIVSGMTDTVFGPKLTATRGQVITMLHRMEGEPAWTEEAAFTDLAFDYYKDAIFWAAEHGVASGYSAESFGPDRAITREELVSLLYRLAGEPETEAELSGFADADSVQDWARDAMRWAVANEVVSGYAEDATLRPQKNASRAEVCAILMRYRSLSS